MSKLHVAIVEDDADDREFISAALISSTDQLTISSFSSGTDFITALSSRKCVPDLVVTDIRMPLITGFDVIFNVKQNESTKNIPVVVLSTSGNASDIERATRLGAAAYYIKPFSLPEYCEITARIISSLNFNLVNKFQAFVSKINTLVMPVKSLVIPEGLTRQ